MALRFPKQQYLTYDNESPLVSVAFSGTTYLLNIGRLNMPVSPSRYSSVRKVTFAVNVASTNVTNLVVRLRVYPSSSSASSRNVIVSPIGPVGGIQGINLADPFGGVQPGAGALDPEILLFDRRGDVTTISQQGAGGAGAATAFIEFDRFSATDTDFFAVWDSIADDDDYMGLAWSLEVVSSGANPQSTSFCFGFSMTTTQAPSPSNNMLTHLRLKYGLDHSGSGLGDFDDTQAVQVRGLHRFRYIASEWDGITAVHMMIHGATGVSNVLGNSYRFVRIDNDATQATTTLLTENFVIPANRALFYRTADLLPFLVDGEDYAFDYRGLGSVTNGPNDNVAYLEITQKGASRTKTFFDTGAPTTWTITGPSTNSEQSLNQQGLFDPLWFEDYPDEFLLTRRIFGSLFHRSAANNPSMVMLQTTDLTTDLSPGGGGSLVMTPDIGDIGSSTFRWQYEESDILTNDPIDQAGKRRLVPFKEGTPGPGHIWTGGGQDRWGALGLVYNFTIPTTESPELGPLFPLGAFNPEGCASTSAGLGDQPGLLVITNGSTIPKHFNPLVPNIEDNGVPVPFCDEVPSTVTGSTGASPNTGLGLGTYVYRYTLRNCCTLKESDPNPDDIVVSTIGESPAATVTLSFAGVRIPGDPQICEICIYRTLLGADFPVMAKVGCFDPSLSTLFVDDVSDLALDFLNDGLSLLNGPMPCVPIVEEFRNRLFGMGDIPELSPAGNVSVVFGSDIVTGSDDVEWDRCLEGKFIQVQGDCRFYEIEKVLPPSVSLSPPIGRLKLVDEYEGTTDSFLNYILCGRPNRLYISEPLEPECWPAANFLDIEPGDGDRLMGAVSNFNRLVICKRNKTYTLQFQLQPATEVVVPTRISSDIGCIGPRTFAQIETGSVWLSDRGVVIYDGRSVRHVPESDQMNNLFIDPENPRYVRRDANGRSIGAVGVFYPKREQYLLLLPTAQTIRGANLMLVWDVKLRNITLLEFCQEFQSMVVAKDSEGNERVYLGDTNGFVWIYDIGDNDGVGFPNSVGTVTGTVTAAGIEGSSGASFLDDVSASFIEGGLPSLAGLSGTVGLSGAVDGGALGMAGACIFTRGAGAGLDDPWQVRTVYASTKTRIYVTPNWGTDTPGVGFEYMIGAIKFEALFKPTNYSTDDYQKRDWKQVLTHLPEQSSSIVRVELLPDFFNSDPEELTILNGDPPATGEGRIFDMSFNKGRQTRPVGRLIHNYQAVRLKNFAPEQPMRILNHSLMLTPRSQ